MRTQLKSPFTTFDEYWWQLLVNVIGWITSNNVNLAFKATWFTKGCLMTTTKSLHKCFMTDHGRCQIMIIGTQLSKVIPRKLPQQEFQEFWLFCDAKPLRVLTLDFSQAGFDDDADTDVHLSDFTWGSQPLERRFNNYLAIYWKSDVAWYGVTNHTSKGIPSQTLFTTG